MKKVPSWNDLLFMENLLAIPQQALPMIVLASNDKSLFSWAIRARTGGHYNHFMWMHRPGYVASQEFWYRERPITDYKDCLLKLWWNPSWSEDQRQVLIGKVCRELLKSKFETRYDVLNIAGQLFGLPGIQSPWSKICSEHASILKWVDREYDLENPDPEDVNVWLKTHPLYVCYGHYMPD